MQMISSLRISPSTEVAAKHSGKDTEFGVNDSLRTGLRSIQSEIEKVHPLQNRLENVKYINIVE